MVRAPLRRSSRSGSSSAASSTRMLSARRSTRCACSRAMLMAGIGRACAQEPRIRADADQHGDDDDEKRRQQLVSGQPHRERLEQIDALEVLDASRICARASGNSSPRRAELERGGRALLQAGGVIDPPREQPILVANEQRDRRRPAARSATGTADQDGQRAGQPRCRASRPRSIAPRTTTTPRPQAARRSSFRARWSGSARPTPLKLFAQLGVVRRRSATATSSATAPQRMHGLDHDR